MSQLPPPQPPRPLPPIKPNSGTGAVVATTAAASGGIMVLIICLVAGVVLFGLCILGIVAAILIPAFSNVSEAAQRSQSMNNVRQIALGLLNYDAANASFPPQYSVDADGQPLHSWRTLLLPYLEQQGMFEQVRQEEAWDSASNSFLADTQIASYHSPRYNDGPGMTNYVAIAGEGFLFNGQNRVKMNDVKDGMTSTIFVVEIANSDIAWAEPRDLTLDEAQFETEGADPSATNVIRGMAIVGFVDARATVLMVNNKEELRKFLTIAGGEPVNPW